MFPTIDLNNPPLDTSLFFSDKCFDYYSLKQNGLYRSRSRTNNFLSNYTTSPNKRKLSLRKNINICKPIQIMTHEIRINKKSKEEVNLPKLKSQMTLLEEKLFKEIKDEEAIQLAEALRFRSGNKLSQYTSNALQEKDQWGSSTNIENKKKFFFSRNNAYKKPYKVKEPSRESIKRLVHGDIKLYIPSRKEYLHEYTKGIVKELLMQSNSGVKYRNTTD